MTKEQLKEIEYLENQIMLLEDIKMEVGEDQKIRAEAEILQLKYRLKGLLLHYRYKNEGRHDDDF